MLKNMKLA